MAIITQRPDLVFKVIVVGDSPCGKTCLLIRFVQDAFDGESQPTLGVEFSSKTIKSAGSSVICRTGGSPMELAITLQLWDTAGYEIFRSVTHGYYRAAFGAVVDFDVTNPGSFKNVASWVKDVKEGARQDVVIALAAMKCDSPSRIVSMKEAQQLAEDHKVLYAETSAKTGAGVAELFDVLVQRILENFAKGVYPDPSRGPSEAVRARTQPQTGKLEWSKFDKIESLPNFLSNQGLEASRGGDGSLRSGQDVLTAAPGSRGA